MKQLLGYLVVVMCLLVVACQSNTNSTIDPSTGASFETFGIDCKEVIVAIGGKKVARNEFVFGEKVNLAFKDLKGFKYQEGKIHPKISMYIVKNKKDTVLNDVDLLKNSIKVIGSKPLDLETNFKASFSHNNNEQYKAFVHIQDKKSTRKLIYELPFTVKKDRLLNVTNNGLSYTNIYLWNNTLKKVETHKRLNVHHSYTLIIDGLEGLQKKENNVYPVFSIALSDNKNNRIISNANLLSAYEEIGINPEDLKVQLTSNLSFSKGTIYNPCRLKVNIQDRHSAKEIKISALLEIF